MIKAILIEYDHMDNTIRIAENDFTTYEALGVLAAASAMIQHDWLNKEDDGIGENI